MKCSNVPQEPNQITNTTEYKNIFKIRLPPTFFKELKSTSIPIMVGTNNGILIIRLNAVSLQELVQSTLGILHRPVAMDISIQVHILRLY